MGIRSTKEVDVDAAHRAALSYYWLCDEAERLGIDTSLASNPALSTVALLAAEVDAAKDRDGNV